MAQRNRSVKFIVQVQDPKHTKPRRWTSPVALCHAPCGPLEGMAIWLWDAIGMSFDKNIRKSKTKTLRSQSNVASKGISVYLAQHICISCIILYDSCMSCRNRVERVRVLSSLDASRVRSRLPRTATQRTKKRDTSRRRPVPCLRHDGCERSCIHVM